MIAYVIKGSTGEYDEYYEWIAYATFTESKACSFVDKVNVLTLELEQRLAKIENRGSKVWYGKCSRLSRKILRRLKTIDKKISHVSFNGVSYRIEELEIEE